MHATTSLCLVLAAHHPRVPPPHPRRDPHPADAWLPRAVLDLYLPLLAALQDPNTPPLTLALSPTLVELLDAEPWRDAVEDALAERLERHRRLAAYDPDPAARDDHARRCADLDAAAHAWTTAQRDLPGAFAAAARAGHLELIPAAAGHGILPLFATHTLRRASVRTAHTLWRERLGLDTAALWLPACAWDDATDAALADAGVAYTVLDARALRLASPRPALDDLAPVLSPRGVLCFGAQRPQAQDPRRAPEISATLDPEDPRGPRSADAAAHAEALCQAWAAEAAAARHANPLAWTDRAPLRAAALRVEDAPDLPRLLRHLPRAAEAAHLAPHTLHRAALASHRVEVVTPAPSSWAPQGHLQPWVGPASAWLLRHLHHLEERAVARFGSPDPAQEDRRGGLQSRDAQAREAVLAHLLHARSADWPELLEAGRHVGWAGQQARDLLDALHRLLTPTEARPR